MQTAAGKAYYTVETAKVGDETVRRYSMIVPGGHFSGYVAVQVADAPRADVLRRSHQEHAGHRRRSARKCRSRNSSALLPFKVSELSGFKKVRTLAPGAAVLLGDATGRRPTSKPRRS